MEQTNWLLKINLPYGSKYECLFPTEKEALIEHMYLESEGLDVSEWSIAQLLRGESIDGNN